MNTLSPDAAAVLNAANGVSSYGPDDCLNESRQIAAAALRAVADRVVPEGTVPSADSNYRLHNWMKALGQYCQRQATRAELLAIADELEGQP